jgi:hypothetical protein
MNSMQSWEVEALPLGYFIAAVCAYSLSEHVITPYFGLQCYSECYDNFNFSITAIIQIEMAFGLLVTKWCILHSPIEVSLCNIKKLLHSCFILHNFCVENREPTLWLQYIYKVRQEHLHLHEPSVLGYVTSNTPNIVCREGTSFLREILADHVHTNNLSHPISMSTKSSLDKWWQALYK